MGDFLRKGGNFHYGPQVKGVGKLPVVFFIVAACASAGDFSTDSVDASKPSKQDATVGPQDGSPGPDAARPDAPIGTPDAATPDGPTGGELFCDSDAQCTDSGTCCFGASFGIPGACTPGEVFPVFGCVPF